MKYNSLKAVFVGLIMVLLFSSAVSAAEFGLSVAPPEIILEVPENACTVGDEATFLVWADGEDLTYQWWSDRGILTDDGKVKGTATDTLVLSSVLCADDGRQFWCVVSNGGGSVTSQKFTLTVNHRFDLEIISDETMVRQATCTERGICYCSCSCGALGDRVFFTDLLAHHGGTATCNTFALCDGCGQPYGDFAPHIFGDWQKDASSHWKECLHCRELHLKADHLPEGEATCTLPQFCAVCAMETAPPKGHCFNSYIDNHDASCTADGTETATCDRCDVTDTRIKENSILPHDVSDGWYGDDDAHWQLCLNCGGEVNRAGHVADGEPTETAGSYCIFCRRELAGAIGHIHKLTEMAAIAPTCTEAGRKAYYICTCSLMFKDGDALYPLEDLAELLVAPLGHSGGMASCNSLARCSRCSEPYGTLADHVYGTVIYDESRHWYSCRGCGHKKDVAEHYGGTADCDTLARCDGCGVFYGSLAEHRYGNLFFDDTCHWAKCNVCGIRTESVAHYGGAASCERQACCDGCGKAYGELLPHIYDRKIPTESNLMAKADCLGAALYYYSCACGAKGEDFFAEGEPLPHNFTLWRYDAEGHVLTCSGCGKEQETEDHLWTKADASSSFREVYHCLCGAEKVLLSHPFLDVSEEDWYYDDVLYVYHHGLLRGMKEDTFGADTETSRAMIVTILHRLEGEPNLGTDVFDDVSPNDWYGAAVLWATEVGVTEGYGNGLFGPDDPVTREQIAAILHRYAQYKQHDTSSSADLNAFPDESDVSLWAETSLSWAVAEGLINGVAENGTAYLKPQDHALRGQVAAVLHRFLTASADG